MAKKYVCFLLVTTTLVAIPATIHAGWMKAYGGEQTEAANYIEQTSDGGYIITGITLSFGTGGDLWLLKTDSLGDTLWTWIYGGEEWETGKLVHQTNDGGYVIVGSTGSSVPDPYTTWIIKTDSLGDTLWTQTYEGDALRDLWIEQCNDGGYIVVGCIWISDEQGRDLWLLKIDSLGNKTWEKTYGGEESDQGKCVQQTADGGYIVTGHTMYLGEQPGDLWLLKIDSSGDTLWTCTYGEEGGDEGNCVQQTEDGGYIIGGCSEKKPWHLYLWLLKTDENGDTVWTKSWGGDFSGPGRAMDQTDNGGYVMVGYIGLPSRDVGLIKTDAVGNTLWTRTYGGGGRDWISSVQQTTDGGYILAGDTESYGAGAADLWLIKTDSEGRIAIDEEPVAETPSDWHVLSSIGSRIVLRYEDRPNGFHAQVFDASGRMVDEIHADGESGTISWGECYGQGVYFIKPASTDNVEAQKVIIVQ